MDATWVLRPGSSIREFLRMPRGTCPPRTIAKCCSSD